MKRNSPSIAMLTGILSVVGSGLVAVARAQSPANPGCNLTLPSFTSSAPNIFNDQQEQYLGDALAEYVESDMKIAPPGKDDQLTRIGERLLATLPPTGVHYRFRIYDSGEVNGFSIAGGHVYISRKLIAAVKNEDELAGVLAHEIGHISTHQSAIEFTRMLRIRLGITQVTDRDDIFAKLHQLYNTPAKPGEDASSEQKSQLVADRVALYAMVRAGYAPQSFVSFLDEITINKGKKGNWLSDFAGITGEESKRYRIGLKLIAVLPPGCEQTRPASGALDFLAWQRGLVEEGVKTVAVGNSGDQPLTLDAPIRPSPWHIRFSQDSHYVLLQDEESITVVDREANRVMFRIDAPDANAAQFTPDSKDLVFNNSDLRVEKWNVATGKRTTVKELLVFDGCNQTLLSADGKTLVCANLNYAYDLPRISLRLIDVESGKPFYDKPAFCEPSLYNQFWSAYSLAVEGMTGSTVATMITSPDGRYLIVAAQDRVLAYDFEHREAVSLGGKLRDLHQSRMSFLGPDQLFVIGPPNEKGMREAKVLSFPDGHLIKTTTIGDQQVDSVTRGRFVVTSPLKSYAAGVWDPNTGQFAGASKFAAIDVWDTLAATEDPTGGLQIGPLGAAKYDVVPMPLGPLPGLRAAVFSPDGKFLAISMRNRAEVWNLESGKQVGMIRPFRSAWMDDQDHLYGQFPKYLDKDSVEYQMTLEPLAAKNLATFEGHDRQYRDFEFTYKPLGKDKAIGHHATLEVKKMGSRTAAWSHDYTHETPACWPAEDSRMVLAWDLSTEGSRDELKGFPNLQAQITVLKNPKKGLLLETVAPETGAPLQQVVLPEADLTKGYYDARRAIVSGNFVLARGEHGNTAIYRLSDGAKVGEFFGSALATDAKSDLIAATNREDEILLVEEHSGKELQRFTLGSPIRLVRIVSGKQLLALTADQVVHRLPLPASSGASANTTASARPAEVSKPSQP